MDITRFIVSSRDEALLYGDYLSYRTKCSRRLLSLRKKLGLTGPKGSKDPLLSDDATALCRPSVALRDNSTREAYLHLLLLTSERAWAFAMQMKAAHSVDSTKNISGSTRKHIVSRLRKASNHAQNLFLVLKGGGVPEVEERQLLEVRAYRASLAGAAEFERQHWSDCLTWYAESRIIYTALFNSSKQEIFKEVLSATIDPSIRYAAYQCRLPRSSAIAAIARKRFPRSDADLVSSIERLSPEVLLDDRSKAAEATGTDSEDGPRTISWRSRTVPIESASISQALSSTNLAASNLFSTLSSLPPDSSLADRAAAYDPVLNATLEAVDATKHAIDELAAEGIKQSDKRMQALQVTRTAVNYALVAWRIARNRELLGELDGAVPKPAASRKPRASAKENKDRVEREEGAGRKLAKLREHVVLYDATLQSIDSINELPGVPADSGLLEELQGKRLYFQSLKCLAIARSHSLLSSKTQALAVFQRGSTHIETAQSLLSALESQTAPFTVQRDNVLAVSKLLAGETLRHRGLVELEKLSNAKTGGILNDNDKNGTTVTAPPLLDSLHTFPEAAVDLTRLVTYPPRLQPVPVKPLFLDVAWNYIDYPGRQGARRGSVGGPGREQKQRQGQQPDNEQQSQQQQQHGEQKAGKGWFSFGR
ncbi:MAG: hypothetical protein M1825_004491 [Sarcosagium campestre]|nr:MAG: hypothetical protein M1825_004491 [Sarcosagium campestre]